MQWENLTADDFADAVRSTGGVCVVPTGVLERHATHLPLGTDMLVSHKIACLAAAREPAVVFPQMFLGQIFEARCFPGTFTIRPALLVEMYEAVFDEIGRNGFRKIIIHNGHGGNWNLLKYLAQSTLWSEKPYTLYVQTEWITPGRRDQWNAQLETKYHGHACECETSMVMALCPELVKADRIPAEPAENLGRGAHLPQNFSGIWWYAAHPEHFAGDPRTASAEKGRALVDLAVASLADFVAAVKKDEVYPALEREFFARERAIRGEGE